MKAIVLGAGGRGRTYSRLSKGCDMEIAAVADPNEGKLKKMGVDFGVPQDRLYTDWKKALEEVEADAVINATPDRIHYETTMAALNMGRHVLLEKPMSPREQECIEMVELAEKNNLILMVCHVLRYAPFYDKVKEIVDSGSIGKIVNMEMTENVAYWHFVHSYVRGVFRNEEESSPFILAKSCHDLDLIGYITGAKCLSVMSEGNLMHYKEENAPEGAPGYCLDGCPHEKTCPHFAPRLYMKPISYVGWPTETISVDTSFAARFEALKKGPFGRCAYRCDNTVTDHQSAIFCMEGGMTVDFNMVGFSSENTRTIRIFGTAGNIRGHLDKGELEVINFLTMEKEQIKIDAATIVSSHGGGDAKLLKDFVDAVSGRSSNMKTLARLSLQSHKMAFAAERSRKEGVRIAIS